MYSQVIEGIKKSSLSNINKMYLERAYIKNSEKINRILKRKNTNHFFYPLLQMNRCFGHEYLLNRYSNAKGDLFSIIEHGMYFGNDTAKVGEIEEWDMGNIITTGNYRENTIRKCFPSYNCFKIGPMIHYAKESDMYIKEIRNKLVGNRKVLLFFPMHSIENTKYIYSREDTINRIIEVAKELDLDNILVCSFYTEEEAFKDLTKNSKFNILVTSCGDRYNEFFLDKQKSLLSLCDVTIANGLGTVTGYCVYMKKPHIIFLDKYDVVGDEKAIMDSRNNSSIDNKIYNNELYEFEKMFSNISKNLTKEQYDLCDYYWGYSHVKTKEEIAKIYDNCRKHYYVFTNNK